MSFLKIAKISIPHAIKGEVKLYLYSSLDDIKKYQKNNNIFFLGEEKKEIKFFIRGSSKNTIARISDINSREEADSFRNQEIFVKKNKLEKLDENEFYLDDLINLQVFDEDNKKIGGITSVSNNNAGDILEISFLADEKKEQFIFNNINFPKIDLKKKTIHFIYPEVI